MKQTRVITRITINAVVVTNVIVVNDTVKRSISTTMKDVHDQLVRSNENVQRQV